VKARPVGVRASLPVIVTVEVVAVAAFVAWPPHRDGWWPAAAVTAATLMGLLVTVYRRNVAGWAAAAAAWWWSRRRTRTSTAAGAVDVAHGDMVCGVRADRYEAITMVAVTGQGCAPTFLRGPAASLTTNLLPLRVLAELLDQPGALRLGGIDVVSAGQRVRTGSGYPALYSTLLADRPAAGRRSTRLIVRLDLRDSVSGLAYRTSIGAAAAAATERIVNALAQEGFRATALSAAEMDTAHAELSAGLLEAPTPPSGEDVEVPQPELVGAGARPAFGSGRPGAQLGWRTVATNPGHLSTYYFSPEDITTAALNQLWALRTDDVVTTVSVWRDRHTEPGGGGPVMVSAIVRTKIRADPRSHRPWCSTRCPATSTRPRCGRRPHRVRGCGCRRGASTIQTSSRSRSGRPAYWSVPRFATTPPAIHQCAATIW
jgi:type VII secretion protein EccE